MGDAIAKLQQTSAFGPFVRKFIMLLQIAWLTGNHNVTHIIRASTRQRDNVLDVVLPPLNLNVAIIATSLLPLVLRLDIFRCVCAKSIVFARTSSTPCRSETFAAMIRRIITTLTFSYSFRVTYPISTMRLTPTVRCLVAMLIFSRNLNTTQPIRTLSLVDIVTGMLIRRSPRLLLPASFTLTTKPIGLTTMSMEVFRSSRQILTTSSAALKTIRGFHVTYLGAFFAAPVQMIFGLLVCKEEFTSSREGLFALNTNLRYNFTHGKVSFTDLIVTPREC